MQPFITLAGLMLLSLVRAGLAQTCPAGVIRQTDGSYNITNTKDLPQSFQGGTSGKFYAEDTTYWCWNVGHNKLNNLIVALDCAEDGLIAAGPLTTQTETFWFSNVPGAMQITAQPFSTVAPYGCISANVVKGVSLVACSAADKSQQWTLIPRDAPGVPSAGLAQLYNLGTQTCLTRPTGSNASDPAAGKGLPYWVTTCASNDRNQVFLLFNSFGGTADPSAQQFNIPACQGHPNQAPAPLSSSNYPTDAPVYYLPDTDNTTATLAITDPTVEQYAYPFVCNVTHPRAQCLVKRVDDVSETNSATLKRGFQVMVAQWNQDSVGSAPGAASNLYTLRAADYGGNVDFRIDRQAVNILNNGVTYNIYAVQAGGVTFASVRIPINQNIGQRRIRNAFLTSQALLSTVTILPLAAAQSVAGTALARFLRSIAQSAVAALPAIWLISQELGI